MIVPAYVHDDPRWFTLSAAGAPAAGCGCPAPASTPPRTVPAGLIDRVDDALALIGGFRSGDTLHVREALACVARGALQPAAVYLKDGAKHATTSGRRHVLAAAAATLLVEIETRSAQAVRQ